MHGNVGKVNLPVLARLLPSELVQRLAYLESPPQVGLGRKHGYLKCELGGQWD